MVVSEQRHHASGRGGLYSHNHPAQQSHGALMRLLRLVVAAWGRARGFYVRPGCLCTGQGKAGVLLRAGVTQDGTNDVMTVKPTSP